MNRSKLIDMLILHEGLRLHVYDDANGQAVAKGDILIGHPTIGIGRNISGDGLGIAEDESKYMLMNDISRIEKEIKHWQFMKDLNEPRQAVIMDMVFNMGVSRFNATQWPNMFNAIIEGDFQKASEEMLASKWAKQVRQRSIRLSQMMRTGEWYES
jgi:lysozyme